MIFKRKLLIPQEVKEMYPISEEGALAKKENDRQIADIFEGRDDRLLLIIGPCSADRGDAVIDYITRLRKVQEDGEGPHLHHPAHLYQQAPHYGCRLQGNAPSAGPAQLS